MGDPLDQLLFTSSALQLNAKTNGFCLHCEPAYLVNPSLHTPAHTLTVSLHVLPCHIVCAALTPDSCGKQ